MTRTRLYFLFLLNFVAAKFYPIKLGLLEDFKGVLCHIGVMLTCSGYFIKDEYVKKKKLNLNKTKFSLKNLFFIRQLNEKCSFVICSMKVLFGL